VTQRKGHDAEDCGCNRAARLVSTRFRWLSGQFTCACRQLWEAGAAQGDPSCQAALGQLLLTGDGATPRDAAAARRHLRDAFDGGHWKAPWLLAQLYKEHGEVEGSGPNCTAALPYLWQFVSDRADWADVSYDALDLLTGSASRAGRSREASEPKPFSALLIYAFIAEQGSMAGALNAGWMLERGQGWPAAGGWYSAPGAHLAHRGAQHAAAAATARAEQSNADADIAARTPSVSTPVVGHGERAPVRKETLRLAAYFYARAARAEVGAALVDYANLLLDLAPRRALAPSPAEAQRLPQRFPPAPGRLGSASGPVFKTIDGMLPPSGQAAFAVQLLRRGRAAGDVEAATSLAWSSVAAVGGPQNLSHAKQLYAAAVALSRDESFAAAFAPRAAVVALEWLEAALRALPARPAAHVRAFVQRKARTGVQMPLPLGHATKVLRSGADNLLRRASHALGGALNLALGPPGVLAHAAAPCGPDPERTDGSMLSSIDCSSGERCSFVQAHARTSGTGTCWDIDVR
jgi:TPR repeat protein